MDRGAIRDAIAKEEALLATLEAQKDESRHRLTAFRAELAAFDAEPEIHVRPPRAIEAPIPRTPADKIRLFRSLFRGREMGCYLITDTMSRRHELSMESYDRLFPSQDTMPRGGFGNLIALPLQHGPRALGNSVFIDNQLRPYPEDEQWSYLASLPRIDVATVAQIVLY